MVPITIGSPPCAAAATHRAAGRAKVRRRGRRAGRGDMELLGCQCEGRAVNMNRPYSDSAFVQAKPDGSTDFGHPNRAFGEARSVLGCLRRCRQVVGSILEPRFRAAVASVARPVDRCASRSARRPTATRSTQRPSRCDARSRSHSSGGSLGAVFEESHHGFRDAGRGRWVLARHEPLGDGDLLLEVRRLDEACAAGAQR